MKTKILTIKKTRLFALAIAIVWIIFLTASYLKNASETDNNIFSLALNEARTNYNKDVLYRRWAALNGGLYVPPTEQTPPNPYLEVPNRDVTTKEGKELTLVNPAYMTRLVHELEQEEDGIKGHITSLNPIRPQNKADEWETTGLKLFEKGVPEFSSLEISNGKSVLRFIAPLVTEKSCLKCHAVQGYKVGDIRGGISITVPYDKYLMVAKEHKFKDLVYHIIAGFFGISGLFIYMYSSEKRKRDLFSEQEKLKESEEKHRLLFETAQEGICVIQKTIFVYNNPMFCEITGYSTEELVDMEFPKIIYPDDLEKVTNNYKRRLAGDEVGLYETRIVKKDSSIIWISISGTILKWNGVNSVLNFIRDITEQKKTQLALAESEQRHRLLAENSTDVIWTIDWHGKFNYISPAVEKLTGYAADEVLKQTPEIFLTPKSIQVYFEGLRAIKDAFRKGEQFEGMTRELEQLCKDGSTVWTEAKISGIYNSQNKLIGVLGVSRDIHERKRVEIELRESNLRFNMLAEQSRTVNWEIDINGLYTYVSPYSEQIIGYKPEELINKKHFYDICPEENREEIKAFGIEAIKNKIKLLGFENPLISKEGKIIWVLSSGLPILNEHEEAIGYRGSDTDITSIKESEAAIKNYTKELETINEELNFSREQIEETLYERNVLIEQLEEAKTKMEEAIREKDKFFSILSHDLKSPFQGLLGLTEIIVSDINDLTLQEIKEYTSLLKESANGIYKLLENLLEWARLQRNLVTFETTSVKLNEGIQIILDAQAQNAANKKIEIVNNISDEIFVYADKNMLNTILRNLISNAIKFTRKNGKIGLTAVQKEDYVEICVKDSGIGIPQEILPKIFKVGEKTSRPGTEGETSTGLGLILCQEYVEKHNGKIWVESIENEGSCFTFSLPIERNLA